MPKEVEDRPPHRDDVFRTALPLEPGRTALVVVDMQRGFVEEGQVMEVPPAREALPRIQELLAIFREKGLPVLSTGSLDPPAAPPLVAGLHPDPRRAAPGPPPALGRPSSACLEADP